jgi:hypothetical protein
VWKTYKTSSHKRIDLAPPYEIPLSPLPPDACWLLEPSVHRPVEDVPVQYKRPPESPRIGHGLSLCRRRARSASHGHLQPAASPARARFRGSRHQSRRAAPRASSRLGRRLACVPTRGTARRGGPPWVRASEHPHHRRRHDGGLHQRTDSVLKHVQHRLRRRVRRWWTRIVLFRVRVSTLRPRH